MNRVGDCFLHPIVHIFLDLLKILETFCDGSSINPCAAETFCDGLSINPCAAGTTFIQFQACFGSIEISLNLTNSFW